MTYFIIPSNHPTYKFPLNLEDYVEFILNQVKNKINMIFDYNIDKKDHGIFENNRDKYFHRYIINITNIPDINKYEIFMIYLGFSLKKNIWSLLVE